MKDPKKQAERISQEINLEDLSWREVCLLARRALYTRVRDVQAAFPVLTDAEARESVELLIASLSGRKKHDHPPR